MSDFFSNVIIPCYVKKVFEETTAAKILMTLIVFGERIREVNRLNVKRLIGNMRLCKLNPFPV